MRRGKLPPGPKRPDDSHGRIEFISWCSVPSGFRDRPLSLLCGEEATFLSDWISMTCHQRPTSSHIALLHRAGRMLQRYCKLESRKTESSAGWSAVVLLCTLQVDGHEAEEGAVGAFGRWSRSGHNKIQLF